MQHLNKLHTTYTVQFVKFDYTKAGVLYTHFLVFVYFNN